MGISEKLGYVRGLADGLNIKDTTPEGRLLLAIVDLLGEMTEGLVEMGLLVQDLEESVDDLISDVYEDDDEDDDGDSRIRLFPPVQEEDSGDDDGDSADPRCLKCGHPIEITAEILRSGFVTCPECGQKMVLDIQGGDCGGGCCGHHSHEPRPCDDER